MKGEKILITGGAGFIGSHLCNALIDKNEVFCFDNLTTGKQTNIEHLKNNKNFHLIKGNVLDYKSLEKSMKGIDYVFHCAAVVGVKLTLEKPIEVLDVIIDGTKNVLEASRKTNVKKVVNISSSEVYGEPVELPEKEDGVLNPKYPYAVAKLVGEKYCESYYQQYGLKTTSLRYFNVYGPRQNSSPYGFVVGIFIKQALKNEPIIIFGDGNQTRDFIYIDDTINATLLSAENDSVNGMAINISSGKNSTILDLAKMIVKIIKSNSKIKHLPKRSDILHRHADISLMQRLLGYQAKYDFEEGLTKTIEWYKKAKV